MILLSVYYILGIALYDSRVVRVSTLLQPAGYGNVCGRTKVENGLLKNQCKEFHCFLFVFQLYWDTTDVSFKYTVWWVNTRVYWEMFTTVRLVNTSFTSHNYHFVVVVMVRTLKFYSQNSFQVYNTVLRTTVTMLYIRSQEIFHPITERLKPLTYISPFPAPPQVP